MCLVNTKGLQSPHCASDDYSNDGDGDEDDNQNHLDGNDDDDDDDAMICLVNKLY